MSATTATATPCHWIARAPDDAPAARHGEVSDPATGATVARVPFAGAAVVDRAVRAAAAAAADWGRASLARRADVLFAMRALVHAHAKVVTERWPDPSHAAVNLGFPTQT